MPLTRMGDSAFDLYDVSGVVPRKGEPDQPARDRVTIYLRNAVAVELEDCAARAFLDLIEALPSDSTQGKSGRRQAIPRSRGGDPDKPVGGEKGL